MRDEFARSPSTALTDDAAPRVTIRGGRMYWPGQSDPPADAEPAWSGERPGAVERLRNLTLLLVVSLYLLFNWGFQQVRIPPVAGGGLPLGEIVLFLSLLTINYSRVLGRLGQIVPLLPFGIWWTFGVGRALFDFMLHGSWALRDAAHVIESLFLLAGFVFAGDPRSLERFFAWLPRLLLIAVPYALLYPFREVIWSLSPTITTPHGFAVPILGSMANTAYLLITAAVYLLLFHGNRLLANLGAVLLLGYSLAIFQARTLYLILIAVFGLIVLYRRASTGNLVLVAAVGGLLLALVALFGVQVQGRLGAAFTFEFLVQHFLAIFGHCDPRIPGTCSAAEGVGQRLEWWQNIWEQLTADPFSLLLGLGYGVTLTDFYSTGGVAVREPHNSYVSVFARTGIIGGICWFLMMGFMLRCWHRSLRHCQAIGWRLGENRLLILMTFFLCMWVLSLGEDGFEKPYNIIPFYFFWGVVLRFSFGLDRGEIGPGTATAR